MFAYQGIFKEEVEMIGLLVLAIIVTIVGLYLMETNKGSEGNTKNRLGGRVASIVGVIIIVISIIAGDDS